MHPGNLPSESAQRIPSDPSQEHCEFDQPGPVDKIVCRHFPWVCVVFVRCLIDVQLIHGLWITLTDRFLGGGFFTSVHVWHHLAVWPVLTVVKIQSFGPVCWVVDPRSLCLCPPRHRHDLAGWTQRFRNVFARNGHGGATIRAPAHEIRRAKSVHLTENCTKAGFGPKIHPIWVKIWWSWNSNNRNIVAIVRNSPREIG